MNDVRPAATSEIPAAIPESREFVRDGMTPKRKEAMHLRGASYVFFVAVAAVVVLYFRFVVVVVVVVVAKRASEVGNPGSGRRTRAFSSHYGDVSTI